MPTPPSVKTRCYVLSNTKEITAYLKDNFTKSNSNFTFLFEGFRIVPEVEIHVSARAVLQLSDGRSRINSLDNPYY
jgi:hypothetical protein